MTRVQLTGHTRKKLTILDAYPAPSPRTSVPFCLSLLPRSDLASSKAMRHEAGVLSGGFRVRSADLPHDAARNDAAHTRSKSMMPPHNKLPVGAMTSCSVIVACWCGEQILTEPVGGLHHMRVQDNQLQFLFMENTII